MRLSQQLKLTVYILAMLISGFAFSLFPLPALKTSSAIPTSINIPAAPDTSFNWAGYAANNGVFSGVSATWIVPNPTDTSAFITADATWVGIGGVKSTDLIQAGTQAIRSPSGQIYFEAWYEKLPQSSRPVSLDVSPGDSITATITQQSAGLWRITIKNNTTNKSFQLTTAYNSSLSSADWIQEMPTIGGYAFIPLDFFGSVQFSNAWTIKDGKKVTIAQSGAHEITMQDSAQQTLASPSPLGSDGSSFLVNRSDTQISPLAVSRRNRFRIRINFGG